MNNFYICIVSQSREDFEKALSLAINNSPGRKIEAYSVKDNKFTIFWSPNGDGAQKLPFVMDTKAATDFVWNWLLQSDFGPEPDHDGSNGHGWKIAMPEMKNYYTDPYAVCVVSPQWAEYRK